jgi:hypothetical protein
MDDGTIAALRGIDPAASYAAVADVIPRFVEAGTKRALISNGRFFADRAGVGLVYPAALRISGKPFTDLLPNEVIIDGQTADALGVGPGDRIAAESLDLNGNEIKISATVASVVVSTAQLRASVGGLLTDQWRAIIDPAVPPVSSLFVATADTTAYERGVASTRPNLQIFRRSEMLAGAIAQANQLVDRTREIAFLVLAVAVLILFVTRDIRAMLQLRARAAAVLIALGVRPSAIARAVIVEQAVVVAMAVTAGTAVGVALFLFGLHLPVPPTELGFLVLTMMVLVGTAVGAVVAFVTYRLSSVPVTRLLFEGA